MKPLPNPSPKDNIPGTKTNRMNDIVWIHTN